MKIQDLAIIFVIIILPISLVLSAYAQYQIQTLNTQTLYDTQLTAATYDAIKAYQINAENSTTSELANSKIRDIEASVSTFRNSIMSAFRLNGYTEEELDNYIPALVYTMYDGFYIYSPYQNTKEGNNTEYGLKPYIPYSCRYKKGSIDVVITYALENYITVQGIVNGNYVNESGYLIDRITVDEATDVVMYNEVTIQTEQLKEYLPIPRADSVPELEDAIPEAYSYVKINGTKYYNVNIDADIPGYDTIIYLSNGTATVQCKKTEDYPDDEYAKYEKLIKNNNQAIQYYKNAKEFTDKVRSGTGLDLTELTYADAYDVDGVTQIWPGNTTKIFDGASINIENELSNFNQHRLAVIRHIIESNLSIAIANYNTYSGSTNDFQMPKLKEDEWDYITHNISLISFLQGLNIGGKIYNGYTIVTNSESKEVVLEPNIYILGKDGDYHRIGDKTIERSSGESNIGDSTYGEDVSAGRLNLDFKRKIITDNNNSTYYYPLQAYNASYKSIVMQDDVTPYDDIYAYVQDKGNAALVKAFYTALGREREGQYKSNYIMNLDALLAGGDESETTPPVSTTYIVTFDANGGSVTPSSQTVEAGTSITLPKPNRPGYEFTGWSTPTGEKHSAEASYKVNEDITFTANWNVITYKVTYNANGGSVSPSSQTVEAGTSITLPKPSTRTGYRFTGWSTPTGGKYSAGASYTVNEDITFTAEWIKTYRITYDANGGSVSPSSQTVDAGSFITLPKPSTRTGYKFTGWSTPTGGKYSAGASYKVNANIKFTANWEKTEIYTITYDANGGYWLNNYPGKQTVNAGESIKLTSQSPWIYNKNHIGWSTDPSATTAEFNKGATITPEGDMTLYAVYKTK